MGVDDPDDPERQEQPRKGNQLHISRWTGIFRRVVLVLGSLHLSVMAALGIWLWSDPRSFGSANFCEIDTVYTVIIGNDVPLHSVALRASSIAIYSLFLAPGFNLILPTGLFLRLFLTYQGWRQRQGASQTQLNPSPSPTAPTNTSEPNSPLNVAIRSVFRAFHAWYSRSAVSPSIVPIVAGLIILFGVNLILLVDIELALRQNRSSDESTWTFGQTLAILLLVLPLRDLLETILARREKARKDELRRREKAHNEELARHEKERRAEHTATLLNAIKSKADMETICDLVKRGADANAVADDCDYATALQLAFYDREDQRAFRENHRDVEPVVMLLLGLRATEHLFIELDRNSLVHAAAKVNSFAEIQPRNLQNMTDEYLLGIGFAANAQIQNGAWLGTGDGTKKNSSSGMEC
ncbi:hypothetical protein C8J57DRAFT_1599987 [Mycena rebaudengoi]|nr:hypothetical protein C8J57DRAFT_1599987 [Mycena rebaudengoi]